MPSDEKKYINHVMKTSLGCYIVSYTTSFLVNHVFLAAMIKKEGGRVTIMLNEETIEKFREFIKIYVPSFDKAIYSQDVTEALLTTLSFLLIEGDNTIVPEILRVHNKVVSILRTIVEEDTAHGA